MSKQADKTNKPAPPKVAKPKAPQIQPTPVDSHLLQLAREDPARLTPTQRTHLQRTLGNQALSRLVSNPSSVIGNRSAENGEHSSSPAHPFTPSPGHLAIQPKLTVNAVGDKYEQEADAVAKEVVQKLNAPQPDAATSTPTAPPTHAQRQTEDEEPIAQRIQRQETPRSAVAGLLPPALRRQEVPEEELQLQRQETEDEDLQLQRQELEEEEPPEMAMLQREAEPEEEELQLQRQELPEEEEIQLQRQELEEEDPAQLAMTQRQPQDFTQGGPVDSRIEAQIYQSRGGGRPMEDSIRQPMEQAFGADFSDVRIHTDTQAHDLNEAIQARAFTSGNEIFFKEGEYNSSSSTSQQLLAHELTHTIQQLGKNKTSNKPNNLNRKEAPIEQSKAYFQKAISYYESGEYRRAIIHFEKARQIQNVPDEIERDCVFNIAQSNFKLYRFATAIIYFEKYLSTEGADIEKASRLLTIAKRKAGIEDIENSLENTAGDSETIIQKAKAIFFEAVDFYENGQYRKAIIRFERIRQISVLPVEVLQACLINIVKCNIRLDRYATTQIYIEQYLNTPGSDPEEAYKLLKQIPKNNSFEKDGNVSQEDSNPKYEFIFDKFVPRDITKLPPPKQTRKFLIRMVAGGEITLGVGGGIYTFEIKQNHPNGEKAYFTFSGVGIGTMNRTNPSISPSASGPSQWSTFVTTVPRSLKDFEGYGRIAAASAGAILGLGYSILTFACDDGIVQTVEGFSAGFSVGFGASWLSGWWEMRD